MENIKRELEDLRKIMQEASDLRGRMQKATVKEKRKEGIIIIKSKIQQESEATEKLITEKIDIKNMGIIKLRKRRKRLLNRGKYTKIKNYKPDWVRILRLLNHRK